MLRRIIRRVANERLWINNESRFRLRFKNVDGVQIGLPAVPLRAQFATARRRGEVPADEPFGRPRSMSASVIAPMLQHVRQQPKQVWGQAPVCARAAEAIRRSAGPAQAMAEHAALCLASQRSMRMAPRSSSKSKSRTVGSPSQKASPALHMRHCELQNQPSVHVHRPNPNTRGSQTFTR
jgi:hypothetical protein